MNEYHVNLEERMKRSRDALNSFEASESIKFIIDSVEVMPYNYKKFYQTQFKKQLNNYVTISKNPIERMLSIYNCAYETTLSYYKAIQKYSTGKKENE